MYTTQISQTSRAKEQERKGLCISGKDTHNTKTDIVVAEIAQKGDANR